MKRLLIFFLFVSTCANGQGLNHQWLLGNNPFAGFPNGRGYFDLNSASFVSEFRKMSFKGTEANISDSNGNLLMSSNGVWIANATGDTMMNGSGLSPSYLTSTWPNGLPLGYGNVFIPFPGDTNSYLLFHKTRWGQFSVSLAALNMSKIDLTLDGGLGAVTIKNDTILADTLSWGIGACKHANGRDWWVVVMEDGNPSTYTILVTPLGIDTVIKQSLGFFANTFGNVSQIIFSPDGTKLIYCTPVNQTSSGDLLIVDFDRCSGLFSNPQVISITANQYLFGLSFSPSGKYAYACSSTNIFQIDIDNLTVDTVATYDGFVSPIGATCCGTTFWNMYLAANCKIYVTSGSSVQHIHEINYPDSAGLACDVQQHAVDLLDYLHLRAVPNHPNYYLGCDTTSGCPCLTTSLEEINHHDFKFSVAPNPNNGNFNIIYLLPQNEKGKLEIYDVNGRRVYEMNLPQWSTMQEIVLPETIRSGMYDCVITSGTSRTGKKIIVLNE